MKNKIVSKVLKFIWNRIKGVDWRVFVFAFWTNYVRDFLKGLVEKSTNKFDDMMFNGIEKLINTFLNPSEKEMSEQARGDAFKEFFKNAWAWISKALKDVDWAGLLYKAWTGYLRGLLKGLVEKSTNKFDNVMFEALDKMIETFLNPKPVETIPEETEETESCGSGTIKNV